MTLAMVRSRPGTKCIAHLPQMRTTDGRRGRGVGESDLADVMSTAPLHGIQVPGILLSL